MLRTGAQAVWTAQTRTRCTDRSLALGQSPGPQGSPTGNGAAARTAGSLACSTAGSSKFTSLVLSPNRRRRPAPHGPRRSSACKQSSHRTSSPLLSVLLDSDVQGHSPRARSRALLPAPHLRRSTSSAPRSRRIEPRSSAAAATRRQAPDSSVDVTPLTSRRRRAQARLGRPVAAIRTSFAGPLAAPGRLVAVQGPLGVGAWSTVILVPVSRKSRCGWPGAG